MSNIIKKYKTLFDTRTERLVTYTPHWKKEDWKCLLFVGELQPNQQPFTQFEFEKVLQVNKKIESIGDFFLSDFHPKNWIVIGRFRFGRFTPMYFYNKKEKKIIHKCDMLPVVLTCEYVFPES